MTVEVQTGRNSVGSHFPQALEQAAGEAAGEDRDGQDGSMRKRRRLLGAVCLVLMCSVLSCNVMWGLDGSPGHISESLRRQRLTIRDLGGRITEEDFVRMMQLPVRAFKAVYVKIGSFVTLNSQPPRAHSRRIRRGSPCSYINFVCATTSPRAATSSAERFARLGAEFEIASHHRVHYFKFASSSRSLSLQPLGNPMFLP